MVSENMIIKYLISCQYFNEYSLNKNAEDVIFTLIKKIRAAFETIDLNNQMKITKIDSNFSFKREETKYFDERIQTDIIENYTDGLKIDYSNDMFNITLNFYKKLNAN